MEPKALAGKRNEVRSLGPPTSPGHDGVHARGPIACTTDLPHSYSATRWITLFRPNVAWFRSL
jgi:hypothetical protein